MKRVSILLLLVCLAANARAARFLFDADHGESAGNADWVIDADLHNLSWTSAGTFTTSSGNESNAQRIPTPPASNIVAGTSETYWSGAISAWAVDLVKRGHSVETLPAGTTLTWQTANAQDLTNYDVVVIDEPNVLFASSEKQALLNFVTNGGSLFMISDHSGSDRNSDGQDSVSIWNDFLTNNGLTNDPFGITFPNDSTSPTNKFYNTAPGDPLLAGPLGVATNIAYFSGNRFQIANANNPTTTAEMWDGTIGQSNTFCMLARLQYGKGRVVVTGDSSSFDDGSGDPNDSSIINGYTGDLNGTNRIWILNASEWLAAPFAALSNSTNSWTNAASGKWEIGTNWSIGTPALANAVDLITNAATKTVTVDSTTVLSNAINGCMTISNLTIAAPSGSTNTLSVNSTTATTLHILRSFSESAGGVLSITNATVQLDVVPWGRTNAIDGLVTVLAGGNLIATNSLTVLGSTNGANAQLNITGGTVQLLNSTNTIALVVGKATNSTAQVTLSGGSLSTTTNDRVYIGCFGSGQVTVSNGMLNSQDVYLGLGAGGSGTLTVTGPGSTNLNVGLHIGYGVGGSGSAWITDGAVVTSRNSNVGVGDSGTGTLGVTNATLVMGDFYVGGHQSGTATFFGATVTANGSAYFGGVTNSVFATVTAISSQLTVTNTLFVGETGAALCVISNTLWSALDLYVGVFGDGTLTLQDANSTIPGGAGIGVISGITGTVWFAGGTATVSSNTIVGDCVSNGVGQIVISNGVFAVTNAAHNAVLDVRDGFVSVVGSGSLLADVIVVTNSCGQVQHVGGGTISATTLVLDPNLSAAGDGIPNGWKQQYSLDPFDPTLGSQDPDHDGFSNTQEYLAGTDPTNLQSSPFRITDIHVTGNDISVTWQPGTGVTNALQGTSGEVDGSYDTNAFADLFAVTNTTGVLINYLDTGGATNFPARYYRVRLVP